MPGTVGMFVITHGHYNDAVGDNVVCLHRDCLVNLVTSYEL